MATKAGREHVDHEVVHSGQRLGHDGVVCPAAFLPVGHESSLTQHLEVKREAGLCGVEVSLQVADAPLTVLQHLEDGEPSLVREGVEQTRDSRQVGSS